MKPIKLFALLLALAFGLPNLIVQAAAQTPSTGNQVLGQVISELERQVIERYVLQHHGHQVNTTQDTGQGKGKKKNKGKKGKSGQLPPGLAKRAQLPPGLAKRTTLPPGLAKRDLPSDLQGLLPARKYSQIYDVDGNAVLIQLGTGMVLDILEGVFQGQ